MKVHQILTGACNSGDRCFSIGSVEGVPFTAYASGCNIVILANTFERVQVIPGVCHDNIQISCVDCSTDTGKIAGAYGKLVCIFEPAPLLVQSSSHRLDYRWIQTGSVEARSYINTLSWNMEGTRLLTAGDHLQMWAAPSRGPSAASSGTAAVNFELEYPDDADMNWVCVWQFLTASPTFFLAFSPDGTLFATSSIDDRLVKIWYDNKLILSPQKVQEVFESNPSDSSHFSISYGYIYLPHPSAVAGLMWRATSKYMPKGSVSNMLLTSCNDNICRVWVETILPDDGLVSLPHIDPVAAQNPRFRMHRHKHRFMQRLKHIKTCFQMRRHPKNEEIPVSEMNGEIKTGTPIPNLPSVYSVHDFHMYGLHASGVTPGFHFHLAATINAETDIPLVPSISSVNEQNFVIHWLNNKDMYFTSEAENILLEVSRRALDKEIGPVEQDQCMNGVDETKVKGSATAQKGGHVTKGKSFEEDEVQSCASAKSHPPLSTATSSTSIATDVTTGTTMAVGDALDRRIESLLRDWLHASDILFSIHPVDGSLLVWILDYLDGEQGAFRQAQVSFCARLPNALPLGDAMTMSSNIAIYNGTTPFFLKTLMKMELLIQDEDRKKSDYTLSSLEEMDLGLGVFSPTPIICMTTKHINGSLNLWHFTVAEDSRFSQILNISHFTRVCGHRFRLNDIRCHPVLPLMLTTSHHNKQPDMPSSTSGTIPADDTPLICIREDSLYQGWCSELILWRVDAVGPLCKSGGVTEISRINSPQVSAFSNAAWIPTLLPSTTLGRVSNSPSACFVASDGECLRVYQAIIDGRALLSEISTAERKKRMMEQTLSLSTDSSLQEHVGQVHLGDIFNVVSEQSTARPGCIIQLDPILDATHDWQNTQFLHVFQEGLIRGEKSFSRVAGSTIFDGDHSAVVDLNGKTVFEEPFYVTLLEKTANGSVMHMWRLVIASERNEDGQHDLDGPPGRGPTQDVHPSDASPIIISTSKVYCKPLPLPTGVEIVHACPSAGHLSSASIYPACFAPYLLVTACSDNTIRFWKCRMAGNPEFTIEWQEWSMISKVRTSSIQVPGELFHVNAAYSGRIAVAFQKFTNEKCVTSLQNGCIMFQCTVAIYECESTGGSEWILSDTFELKEVVGNNSGLGGQEFDSVYLSQLIQNRSSSKFSSAFDLEEKSATTEHHAGQSSVPSLSTLQSLRRNRFENREVNLKQKHPIQLGWLSLEDGSYLLTVAIGNKVVVLSCISENMLESSCSAGGTGPKTDKKARPLLQKSVSMHQMSLEVIPRWIRLEKFSLKTSDGLPPLPMKVNWVRDGILVIGMDNEMQVISQWPEAIESALQKLPDSDANTGYQANRDVTYVHLRSVLKDAVSYPVTSASRITSYSILSALDNKMKKGLGEIIENPLEDVDEMNITGLFEASHLAAPVLPQYHPRQINELLNSGKIRRVKAILAHLLRCLMVLGLQTTEPLTKGSFSDLEDTRKSWSRTRTVSLTPNLREQRNSVQLHLEEINLDYIEIKAIPPLPLWLLLEADKETQQHQRKQQENQEDKYSQLFGPALSTTTIDIEDLSLEEGDEIDVSSRRKSLTQDNKGLAYFGPRQAQGLAGLLTHTHLPGLSSLDQMHLLALADTVASCNVDFADRFDINKAKEAIAKETYSRSATDEPSMDSLDDCGLRFLLAMRHHTYLMKCLPFGQRAALQKAGIGCHNIVWAFHSESQDEILDFLPSMRQGTIRWSELRELGAGWWVKSNESLCKVLLKVAKAAFMVRNNPLDAAIYYLAMQKKNLVWGLFRSINDSRMTDFFANSFSTEKWRKAALKNAFALMGKQRFEHAAAFFLLAGALKDAVEVVLNKLQDEQLAFVIIRLYEGELDAYPLSFRKLLYTLYLGSDENGAAQELTKVHPDPFLRSISYWMLKDYNKSLSTLLLSDPSVGSGHPDYKKDKLRQNRDFNTADPGVFNFYIYLRTHPLLIRQCIANSAKDSIGSYMASRLASGNDALDKKSLYQSIMTPQERCLYFTTASAHLCSGCPTLALEVLSKLPDNVIDLDNPDSEDLLGRTSHNKKLGAELIKSGTLDMGSSFENAPPTQRKDTLDWSVPVSLNKSDGGGELELDFALNEEEEEDIQVEIGVEKNEDQNEKNEDGTNERKHLDIMAQQLKFICCLKIMMEELATLATGCEVDGGQLRYQLYVWLEREVDALKEVCNYRSDVLTAGTDVAEVEDEDRMTTPSPLPLADQPKTLHEILQQENLEFEAKRKRAVYRKHWLLSNQQLLRTLLSYCSLHGSCGGGLASVRMELILLLQELQQESNKQQLLSPLPLPTMLPLLSASVASNKTVVADPVRHLQCGTQDLLQSLIEINSLDNPHVELMTHALVLRNLAAGLSACIYQSLCDCENLSLKTQPRIAALGLDVQFASVAHKPSHLLSREPKAQQSEEEKLLICTAPSKWPGVSSLLTLMVHEKDEDTPNLNILLLEAFVAVYLCLMVHGIASSDAYVLYRIVSIDFKEKDWGQLFGGGVKKVVRVITNIVQTQGSTEKESSPVVAGERILSTITNLQKSRIKLNMKFLGQLGFQDPRSSSSEGDTKSGTRESFRPPELSIVSYLMTKPSLPPELQSIDYDSSASDDGDMEEVENEEEEEDVFQEPKICLENTEHSNTESYSWCILRLACVRRAQFMLRRFLDVAEVDFQELAMQTTLVHSVLKTISLWINSLVSHLEGLKGPPPEYIPGCFAQSTVSGPAILKYKALLEPHNTPFVRNKRGVKPVIRLWNYLVRQEQVQDVFVRYIFGRKRPTPSPPQYFEPVEDTLSDTGDGIDSVAEVNSEAGVESQAEPSEQGGGQSDTSGPMLEPVRIIHKDQDSISSFCLNIVNPNLMALATLKEVQELDISLLLKHPSWLTNECELDVLALNQDPDTIANPNFLVIQSPLDKHITEGRGSDVMMNLSGSPVAGSQTGRGTNVLKDLKGGHYQGIHNPNFARFILDRSRHYLKPVLSYKVEGTRRMTSHPVLPLYLTGSQDGSVIVREWRHKQMVSQPRTGGTFAKVTRVRFNQQGNKFGVIDGDGHLSLYHLGITSQNPMNNKPYYTHQCHNKHGNDFTFVGSSSLLATAGQSSEHRNIALWDTLMSSRKGNIISWTCHESGASALAFAPQHQILISAGKRGQVCIFDVRQRTFRHKFQAHESSIKSMALDINEDFFVTGSVDGDIKVWGLSVHNLIYNLPGEHSKTSLFKNLSQGVTHLTLDANNRLYSCGADGSVKMRCLPERDLNINLL